MLNVISGLLSGGVAPTVATSYESIATVTVGAGGASSITFTGIPSTYKHLQLRGNTKTNRATYGVNAMYIQVGNGSVDTGANYSRHDLEGDGSTAYAEGFANTSNIYVGQTGTTVNNNMGATVIDVLDYTNVNKYKTLRILAGTDCNGTLGGYGGVVSLASGNWRSTSTIDTVTFTLANGVSFVQYSQFALYGIKG